PRSAISPDRPRSANASTGASPRRTRGSHHRTPPRHATTHQVTSPSVPFGARTIRASTTQILLARRALSVDHHAAEHYRSTDRGLGPRGLRRDLMNMLSPQPPDPQLHRRLRQ